MFKSAVGIVYKDGKLLMGKSTDSDDRNGKWCFPGGGIEKGESGLEAAIREIREEAGIIAKPMMLSAVVHPDKPKVCFYCLQYVSGYLTPNEEFSAMDWFSIYKLPMEMMPCNIDVLKVIGGRGNQPVQESI